MKNKNLIIIFIISNMNIDAQSVDVGNKAPELAYQKS